MFKVIFSIMYAFFFFPTVALAESSWLGFGNENFDRPMETDRPSFSATPGTVTPGHVLIESGYTYTYDKDNGVKSESHVLPELLFRLGIFNDLEARLAWTGYKREEITQSSANMTTDGFTGIILGVKHKMYQNASGSLRLAYIAEVALPSGSSSIGENETVPKGVFIWSMAMSERFTLGGNVNLSAPVSEGDRYLQTDLSLIGSGTIFGDLSGFIEYYSTIPNNEPSDVFTKHVADAGLTYLIDERFQLDAEIGFGLNEAADDFFTGVGFSCRF